ncbi:MAG: hypothetical protein JWL77_4426 [Chthonomonadaceae bacterium]|nr:hypothetical protein [Chthonomonadaceae bacterium]
MPDTTIGSFALNPSGGQILTPPLVERDTYGYRIVLEGVCRFGYTGEVFDAVYRWVASESVPERHRYLKWTPGVPILESEDRQAHRYVFRVAQGSNLQSSGGSVAIGVDPDPFIDQYTIPLSEVQHALSGSITITVRQFPLAPISPWPLVGWIGLPAALAVGGLGVVIRRRMALRGLEQDLLSHLDRIEQKARAARGALSRQDGRLLPVAERISALRAAALALIRQIQETRDVRRQTDARLLAIEIEALEGNLAGLKDPEAQCLAERALEQKRRSRELLDDLARAETNSTLRLNSIEALLDTACLTLHSARIAAPAAPAEESLCHSLDAEVAAIHEAAREMARCDTLQAEFVATITPSRPFS